MSPEELATVANDAARTLQEGGVIVYPTDTIYGLGVDAFNEEAVAKLFELKGRDGSKPIHVVVSDMAMIERYAIVTPLARRLAESFFPGALTLVLEAKEEVPPLLVANTGTIGVRIPHNDFCRELSKRFDRPYTSTSANKSGDRDPYSIDDVRNSFGDDFPQIDYVVDAGHLVPSLPSTVVDARGEKPIVLRQGVVNITTF